MFRPRAADLPVSQVVHCFAGEFLGTIHCICWLFVGKDVEGVRYFSGLLDGGAKRGGRDSCPLEQPGPPSNLGWERPCRSLIGGHVEMQ